MKDFFAQIYKDKPTGHYITLWTLPEKKTFWFSDLELIPNLMSQKDNHQNIFFGVGSSSYKKSNSERIKTVDVHGMGCLHLDIDFGESGHKGKKYAPDIQTAIEISELILLPSSIVMSGHGIHAYYFFKSYQTKPENIKEVARLLKTFQILTKTLTNYAIDMTHDLARVLRVPTSTNYKEEPILTEILTKNYDTRYDLKEINDALKDKTIKTSELPFVSSFVSPVVSPVISPIISPVVSPVVNPVVSPVVNDLQPNDSTEESSIIYNPLDELTKYKIINSRLKFNNDRELKNSRYQILRDIFNPFFDIVFDHNDKDSREDTSTSSYDMSLANMAAEAGFLEQEICDLLILHRQKYKQKMKFPPQHDHYYGMTIYKAWTYAANKQLQEKKMNHSLSSPTSSNDSDASAKKREGILIRNQIESILGIRLNHLIKYEMDPAPDFWLEIQDIPRLIHLGSYTKGIMAKGTFMGIILGEMQGLTNCEKVRYPNKKQWPELLILLSKITTVSKAITNTTFIDEMTQNIRDYIEVSNIFTDKQKFLDEYQKSNILLENDYYFFQDKSILSFLTTQGLRPQLSDLKVKISQIKNINSISIKLKNNKNVNFWKLHKNDL